MTTMPLITEMTLSEKMTLRQVLNRLAKTTMYISIGAERGSGWMYIGPAEDAMQFMNAENTEWQCQILAYIDRLHANINLSDDTRRKNTQKLTWLNKSILTDEERYARRVAQDKVQAADMRIQHYNQRIQRLMPIYSNWVNLLNRKVVRVFYQKVVHPYTLNILFDGEEFGDIWTYEEFERIGRKKRLRILFK